MNLDQPSLLDWKPYPETPGYKRRGTSRSAAEKIAPRAPTLRERVLALLKVEALSADQCAAKLGVTVLSARPRVAELHAMGLVEKLPFTRTNESGLQAHVWKAI